MLNIIRNTRYSFHSMKVPAYKMIIDPKSYRFAHPVWSLKDAETVEIIHHEPTSLKDRAAFYAMKIMRTSFDYLTGSREIR